MDHCGKRGKDIEVEVRMAKCKLRSMNYEVQITKYELRSTNYEVRTTKYKLQSAVSWWLPVRGKQPGYSLCMIFYDGETA
jgi:hypothetical protein